jgi:glycosyltransferase involved in cell wall biosynthesis
MDGGVTMTKYSILIPVYNGAKYIEKCLDSVLDQSYEDYEVIIVNDGSTDNTEEIIKRYQSKRLRYYKKKNGGVSDARNYCISKVKSDYFTFVDSDDYISRDMLKVVDKEIDDETEILSFNISVVSKCNDPIYMIRKPVFKELSGEKAIVKFIEEAELFDTPVSYIYKTSYFVENNFKYAVDRVHEDFGLTPVVIIKAKNVSSIGFNLYYYVLTDRSITRDISAENNARKAWDMLYHFDYLYLTVNSDFGISNNTKIIFNSYIANAIISKIKTLSGKNLRDYLSEIKSRKVYDLLLCDTFSRRVKKQVIKIIPRLYLNLLSKRGNR